jgi:hypothetical protein
MIIENNWVSSSPRFGGVTIKPLKDLDNENWDYITIDVDGRKKKKVIKFIEDNKNTKYDWFGLFFGTAIDNVKIAFLSLGQTIFNDVIGAVKTTPLPLPKIKASTAPSKAGFPLIIF